ncbi:CPBP family intramembrane glutamic endopeptidase [Massilia mucilaginosa]|uniref:CPBP family intramembrane glutamic endopeptidase n=1 Tax=Massilia mucilaginosa TaxID=2609282 RepID=UPI00141D9B29|nr:CPBP family intramembrane glutamic endopeptidase [Massilia mucilaginosa]
MPLLQCRIPLTTFGENPMLLDWLFGLCLFLLVPAYHLWSPMRQKTLPPSRIARYWSMIGTMGVLLLMLLAHAWQRGQGADMVGIGFDLSANQRYLVAAAIVVVALWHLGMHAAMRMIDTDAGVAQAFDKMSRNQLMPRTLAEARLYVLFVIVIGIGSDLLYRGFLINTLVPVGGAIVAILLASLADALTYGYDKPRDIPGNIALSLVLGIAFYLSQSLLWIIVLHLGLGLSTARIAWQATHPHGSA